MGGGPGPPSWPGEPAPGWRPPPATSPTAIDPVPARKPRYAAMVEHFALTTAEQLTCGAHVHVEVASDEEGVAVLDRIRVWLPVLLAVSANSPSWQGRDSGYASYRYQAWGRFPSAGPSPIFSSAGAYRDLVDRVVASGVLLDHAMIYFDARLSQRYPTVEVRVADVCLRVGDTVLLAALVRGLVDTAAANWRRHAPAPQVATELIRMASWRASRSGLSDTLVDPLTSRPRRAADVVATLVEHVRPALRRSGDLVRVEEAWADLRGRGSGAVEQRRWAATTSPGQVALRAASATLC